MLESTKQELLILSQNELRTGNKPLALFFERIAKNQDSIVAEVWRGVLNDLHGLPSEVQWLLIDHESIEGSDEPYEEEIKGLLRHLSYDEISRDSTFSDMKTHLEKAIKKWKDAPTSETRSEVFNVSIMIPARDFADIKRSLRKRTFLNDQSIMKRNYDTEVKSRVTGKVHPVKFIALHTPMDLHDPTAFSASWTVFDEFGAHSVYYRDITKTVELEIASGLYFFRLEVDPTYE